MALVTFKQPTSKFSGRTGSGDDGQVFYTLDGRGISRTLVAPTNPNTTYQQTIRAIQTSLSAQYSSLTRTQADAWDTFGKNFSGVDRLGRKYSYGGIQAFLAVNTHRVLAGQSAVTDPPIYVNTPSPIQISSVTVSGTSQLTITAQHLVATGSGFWRVRITPALDSAVRLAQESELRVATTAFADSYVAVAASPQAITLTTKFTYAVGNTLGIELTGLSSQYVPGQTLFVRHIAITA
jgi:hypothetical protein